MGAHHKRSPAPRPRHPPGFQCDLPVRWRKGTPSVYLSRASLRLWPLLRLQPLLRFQPLIRLQKVQTGRCGDSGPDRSAPRNPPFSEQSQARPDPACRLSQHCLSQASAPGRASAAGRAGRVTGDAHQRGRRQLYDGRPGLPHSDRANNSQRGGAVHAARHGGVPRMGSRPVSRVPAVVCGALEAGQLTATRFERAHSSPASLSGVTVYSHFW